MRRNLGRVTLSLVLLYAAATAASAAIFPQDRGAWPDDWPKELEPLRDSSRTVGVGTGIQENIYEIPIRDRETFDKVWPAIRSVCTPGCRLTLYRVDTPPPKMWGDFLSNKKPAVRLYGPSNGYAMKEETSPQKPPDLKELIDEGRALRARDPWPKEIVGPNGELPEYVVAEKGADGRLVWTPANPFDDKKPAARGFYNRARIDIDLVIDGDSIDLNRLEFPDGVQVIDHRFDDPPETDR